MSDLMAELPDISDYDDSNSSTARAVRLIRSEADAAGFAEAIALLRDLPYDWEFDSGDAAADYLAAHMDAQPKERP